jgi:hypothetical protein
LVKKGAVKIPRSTLNGRVRGAKSTADQPLQVCSRIYSGDVAAFGAELAWCY